MTIRYCGDTVTVDAHDGGYVIEPARFKLGLSRVEMVDTHLARLATRDHTAADVDVLLDARAVFTAMADPDPDPEQSEGTCTSA